MRSAPSASASASLLPSPAPVQRLPHSALLARAVDNPALLVLECYRVFHLVHSLLFGLPPPAECRGRPLPAHRGARP